MAKKKSKNSKKDEQQETARSEAATAGDAASTIANDEDEDDYDGEEDELELLQVETGDMVKLKQVLDEGVAGALLEHLPEDYGWDNLKLGLMFVACAFAMVAQFAPVPFPESRPILGVCGSAYFIFSGILQLIATFIDKDAILWTYPLTEQHMKESSFTYRNRDLQKYGLQVRSSLPRFSEWFTVIIQFHMKDEPNPPKVSQTWSVGKFFDKEGYFDEVGLTMEVDKLFERFNKSQYDTEDTKAKKE